VSPAEFAFLVAAGIVGGLTGSIAGLASLATYPALLAVGLTPVSANVTNTVALVFTGVGSMLGSRPELVGQAARLRTLAPIAAVGGAIGAALLLSTPAEGFEKLVPLLLGGASLTILIPRRPPPATGQEVLPPGRAQPWLEGAALLLIAIYGGYFGAAAGVLLLALLLRLTHASLARANATKNALLFVANSVAAVAFAFLAPVEWAAVVPLGIGCLLGSRLGPIVVRRAPAPILRVVIGLAGMALAIRLGIQAYA
jgi:uncharacterized membrane protein YfcA